MAKGAKNADEPQQGGRRVLLFRTTHGALQAEETLIDAGFWCDVVPRPPAAATELCGLAVEILARDAPAVERLFANTNVAFAVFQTGE